MMPKYKVRVVETIAQVAYVYIDAEDDTDAWDRAEDALYDIKPARFALIDNHLEVTDIEELAEEESENETTP